jgi:hypothetical protein
MNEMMTCEDAIVELVECARRGAGPDNALEGHMAVCGACRERWVAERELTSHLRVMRMASGAEAGTAWSKAVLMREFDAHRRRERQVRWMWAMSSAAVLVLSVVAVRDVRMRPAASPVPGGSAAAARAYTPKEYPQEAFVPAEEAGEKGFIQVPFALPPAPGETFGIVRTQLDPADLARMGVSVDPGWSGTLQADVLVGEDGLAQAVRLSNEETGEN